jgi:anti-sigma regulatory factor (Ser/Thr protein kinase)
MPDDFNQMEKHFQRDINSLDKIFEFICEFIAENKIDESTAFSINFAIEEIFTNMVKYNPENQNNISISLNKDGNKLILCLTDYDVGHFDITKLKEVDTGQPLQERKVGGLGLHIVKQMVDEIDYEYKNRNGRITIIKHLEN